MGAVKNDPALSSLIGLHAPLSHNHLLDHAAVLLVLAVVDADQQQIALVILQRLHIVLLLDLINGP